MIWNFLLTTSSLISTNIHLSALDVVRYYAKRWKIEQMIKDLKQRLGFGDYQTRCFQAILRHAALSLIAYFVLTVLKVFQWLGDKKTPLLSIRLLPFQVRKFVLIELISVTLKNMKFPLNKIFSILTSNNYAFEICKTSVKLNSLTSLVSTGALSPGHSYDRFLS